ncbi:MAG: DUF4197 domain-containing protein [Desulfobacula sp.]|nr:DUF4197 domain-containing protein [Desulfobacula sp.]
MKKEDVLPLKFISMMVAILLMYMTTPLFASNFWIEKGTEFLKSFGGSETAKELSIEEIGSGLKEALRVGSGNVVKQLGATDGFNKDSTIHIPLPPSLDKVKTILSRVGMSSLFEDLELKLNRAAELATPKAKQLFLDSISKMTFQDVKQIYEGPNDAATQYFKSKMTPDLAAGMKPVIENSLSEVGAIRAYDTMMAKYKSLPFVPDVRARLTEHVIEKGMDGIFYYVAKEEAAIRQNPAKRTTELLKKIFTK